MNPNIRIAVTGGTGKSGKYVVQQLIQQGYAFKLLVRNLEHFTITNPLIEVVHGDVTNAADVRALITGCNAVISTLGLGIPPSEPTIFAKATTNILAAMKEFGIRRYIVTTGLNVTTPADAKSAKTQMATDWMYEHFPKSTQNKQEEYELLANSDADWTMVRLPMVQLTDEQPEIAISLTDCPGDGISATSLAQFLINQLQDESYIRKAPFIANK